jgi:carboxymethylenebutenolidase
MVAFHGADTEKFLDEADSLTSPTLMHLAGRDEFISGVAQTAINAALSRKPNVEIFTYPGCRHAFARHGGEHYDPDAAALANARTWDFLCKTLRPDVASAS